MRRGVADSARWHRIRELADVRRVVVVLAIWLQLPLEALLNAHWPNAQRLQRLRPWRQAVSDEFLRVLGKEESDCI